MAFMFASLIPMPMPREDVTKQNTSFEINYGTLPSRVRGDIVVVRARSARAEETNRWGRGEVKGMLAITHTVLYTLYQYRKRVTLIRR